MNTSPCESKPRTEVGPPLAPLGKMRMDLEDGGPPGGVSLVISSEGEILTEL